MEDRTLRNQKEPKKRTKFKQYWIHCLLLCFERMFILWANLCFDRYSISNVMCMLTAFDVVDCFTFWFHGLNEFEEKIHRASSVSVSIIVIDMSRDSYVMYVQVLTYWWWLARKGIQFTAQKVYSLSPVTRFYTLNFSLNRQDHVFYILEIFPMIF